MGKHKIYISLPITGYDLEERKERAEEMKAMMEGNLRRGHVSFIAKNGRPVGLCAGNTVVATPFDIVPDATGMSYAEIMARDLKELMESQVVCFAKGWHTSKGCRVEFAVAKELGLTMCFE